MELYARPRLAPGCRLHPTEALLLIPEGTLQLSGPSRRILEILDGQRTVSAVVDHLLAEYLGAEREQIEQDVLGLLQRLEDRGVVRVAAPESQP